MELLARWRDKLAGEPKLGWSEPPPPQTKDMGVGRQQQHNRTVYPHLRHIYNNGS